MLRGVNVSGHKPIKMDALRASFESLGFEGVKTYLQSGNVVFTAAKVSVAGLTAKIAAKIMADFGHAVAILIRTPVEFEEALKRNPFAGQTKLDEAYFHITFLSQPAGAGAGESLNRLATASEQIFVSGREVYLYCPNGYGNTKVSNTAIEKKLGAQATTRNWRTVNALLALAQA